MHWPDLRRDADPLVVWGLASFHAATFIYVVVAYSWFNGGLRGLFGDARDSGSLIGLGAFAILWFAAYVGTARSLPKKLPSQLEFNDWFRLGEQRGVLGGAIAGVAFLAVLIAIAVPLAAVAAVIEMDPQVLLLAPAAIGISAIGVPFAAVIGGFLGLIAGIADTILLAVALAIAHPSAPLDTKTPTT
jgi:hypothetical protein